MEAIRLDVKWFMAEGSSLPLDAFVPVMHRWIQTKALGGLLIDVASYAHVPQGPGVVLVGHHAHHSIDEAGGRRGLLYSRRRDATGTFAERARDAISQALHAARLLETDRDLAGKVRFDGSELLFRINDRLLAPATPETLAATRAGLAATLDLLWGQGQYRVEPATGSGQMFQILVKSTQPRRLQELLERLA